MNALEIIFLFLCVLIAAIFIIGILLLLLYAIIDRVVLKDFKGGVTSEKVQDIPLEEKPYERIVYEPPIFID